LLTDSKGQSRQVAFVQYTNRQDAEHAIMNLSGVIPPGGKQSLIVKYATPPKITSESEEKNSSDSQPNGGPYVGEISTHVGPPQMQQHQLYHHQPSPPLPAPPPEIFSAPQFPLSPYHPPVVDKLVYVTINGIPPSFDLMTFNFLSNYGRVVEGKLFYQPSAYVSPTMAPLSQQPSPQLRHGTIQFILLTEDTHQLANLLTLDASVVVVSGVPVVV
jgi:RNA recognition motif-containing protein